MDGLSNGGLHRGDDGQKMAAGAVVTKNVPPYAVVVGVPAKVIKYRFSQEIIDKLQEMQWWDWPKKKLKARIELFQNEGLNIEDLERIE